MRHRVSDSFIVPMKAGNADRGNRLTKKSEQFCGIPDSICQNQTKILKEKNMWIYIINEQLPNGKGLITLPNGKKVVTPVPCELNTMVELDLTKMYELYNPDVIEYADSVGIEYRTPGYYMAPMMPLSDGADMSSVIDLNWGNSSNQND